MHSRGRWYDARQEMRGGAAPQAWVGGAVFVGIAVDPQRVICSINSRSSLGRRMAPASALDLATERRWNDRGVSCANGYRRGGQASARDKKTTQGNGRLTWHLRCRLFDNIMLLFIDRSFAQALDLWAIPSSGRLVCGSQNRSLLKTCSSITNLLIGRIARDDADRRRTRDHP